MEQIDLAAFISGATLPDTKSNSKGLGDFLESKKQDRSLQTPQSFLDSQEISSHGLTTETRKQMRGFMVNTPAPPHKPSHPEVTPLPTHSSTLLPGFLGLVREIKNELQGNLSKLLSLNPSRREAVAQYLDSLSGIVPGPSTVQGGFDAAAGLRRWIEGPRSVAQNRALDIFFEEVALVCLGQAVVLKGWSDRGLHAWKREYIGKLNYELSMLLKPKIPLDRDGWQITRPNLYSWYNPSPALQAEIWNVLEPLRFKDEGTATLATLLKPSHATTNAQPELQGFDPRFYKALWDHLKTFGLDPEIEQTGHTRRRRVAFSPTLRNGLMAQTGPSSVQWIGLESNPYQILIAELMQLWWGPASPPIWALGNGLETHSREQLSLGLSSPRPSIYSRICEMEACDLSIVLEERVVRLAAKTPEAARLREQLESLPYFKKLRSPGTSLGDLQACVALSKLRPGGLMWWSRPEPLTSSDGNEMLHFMLERSKLICEWDLSGVEHSLPTATPLFPRYLYLFIREPDVQQRLTHRPARISVSGQMRSHVEMPLLLEDALQAVSRSSQPRGLWQVRAHVSPTCQKDWADRWPDPSGLEAVRALEELQARSTPLASATTIRHTPQGDPERDHAWSVHSSMRGFWIAADYRDGVRRISAYSLPGEREEVRGSGYLVLVSDESWIAPLRAYLESECIQKWLDHHAERKGERWILNEQIVKFIPIPKALLHALAAGADGFATRLPGDWERLASLIGHEPSKVLASLGNLDSPDCLDSKLEIRSALFVRAARSIESIRCGQRRLLALVSEAGKIRWRDLLDILPKSECMPIALHSGVRLSGALPPHLPIGRIDRIKSPGPGILLSTESGFNLTITSENNRLLDMLWDQLDGLQNPTWNELAQHLRLPRRLEVAETTANDVLTSHGELSGKLRDLAQLLSACSIF